MGSEKLARAIAQELLKVFGKRLVSAAIFGSAARGKPHFPESDLDILIVVDDVKELGLGPWARPSLHAIDEALSRCGIRPKPDIDLHMLSRKIVKDHPPILLDMTEHIAIGHDKDDFLKKVLEELRNKLKELGAKKMVLPDGSWYWILKPDLKFGEVVKL